MDLNLDQSVTFSFDKFCFCFVKIYFQNGYKNVPRAVSPRYSSVLDLSLPKDSNYWAPKACVPKSKTLTCQSSNDEQIFIYYTYNK